MFTTISRAKLRQAFPRWLCAVLLPAIGFCSKIQCQEIALELDPANTHVEFTLAATLHTVHGTFALKSGMIHFNLATGSASGSIVVDAVSGESGNQGRDHKMHQQILESSRYPEITFTPIRFSGKVELEGNSTVELDGMFRLHGADHPLTLSIPVQMKGNSLSARTQFTIPYIAWGLKNPSTFVLHVSDKVDIDITAVGHVRAVPPQGAAEH